MTNQTEQAKGMNQGVLAAVLVGVVGIAVVLAILFASGVFGGSTTVAQSNYEQRITQLESEVAALNQALASGAAAGNGSGGPRVGMKIAYVDMFKVLETLGTELADPGVLDALEQYQQEEQRIRTELQQLQQQFANDEITLQEFEDRQFELELELQQKNLELSAPIQQSILEQVVNIGRSQGYAMVLDNPASKLSPIILYNQSGVVDNITSQVIDALSSGENE